MSVNKYLEAKSHKLSVGMRFKMRFEGDEVPERRYIVPGLTFCRNLTTTCLSTCFRNLTGSVAQLLASMILHHQLGQTLNGDL